MRYLKQFNQINESSTDLITAVKNGDIEAVKKIIDAGTNLDIKDNSGWTSLIRSSSRNNIEVVKLLIDAGANLDIQNNGGSTALIEASSINNIEVVKLLLDNFADEFIVDNEGNSFYHYLNDKNKDIIKKLYPNEVENAIMVGSK